jgi:Transposase DDE domain
LDRLGEADRIDWERAALDSASVPAPGGGEKTGPNPRDRGKQGSKRHLVVDGAGIPLAVRHTAANIHDSRMLEELVDAVVPIRQPKGSPVVRVSDPRSCTLTRDTTSDAAGRHCASGGSRRASLDATSTRARGWDGTGG